MSDDKEDAVNYTDGRWIATTMGQFLQILVDSGQDPCVIFRVTDDIPVPDSKTFVRLMAVFSVPNGAVVHTMNALGFLDKDAPHAVNKVLAKLLESGLVW